MAINGKEMDCFRDITSFYGADEVLDIRECLDAIKDELSQKEREEKMDFAVISSILHQLVWRCVDIEIKESAEMQLAMDERKLIVERLVDEMLGNIFEEVGFDRFDFHVDGSKSGSKFGSELEMEDLILDEINDICVGNEMEEENFEFGEEIEEVIGIEDVKSGDFGLFKEFAGFGTKDEAGSQVLEERNDIFMENVMKNENSSDSRDIFDGKMENIANAEIKLEDFEENDITDILMENYAEGEKTSILNDNFDENQCDFEETTDKNPTDEVELQDFEKTAIFHDILTENEENPTENVLSMETDHKNGQNMPQIVPELVEINIADVKLEKKMSRENERQVPKLEDDIEADEEDFYPDEKPTEPVEKNFDSAAKIESHRRSVLRLGLSRKQKVKQLHNYLFQK